MLASDRKRVLLFQLKLCFGDHRRVPDRRILILLRQTIRLIEANEIAIPTSSTRKMIFGKVSLSNYVSENWGPILDSFFYKGSIWSSELSSMGAQQPPSLHFDNWSNFVKLEKMIRIAISCVHDYPTQSLDAEKELLRDAESLCALSDIFFAIVNFMPKIPLNWCRSCFRRAKHNRHYCREHKPSITGENDTNYKKSKRARKFLSQNLEKYWESYRIARNLNGGSISFILKVNDIPMDLDGSGLIVSSDVREIVYATQEGDWSSVAFIWQDLIDKLPGLAKLILRKPSEFLCWSDFVVYCMEILKDPFEDTKNPYWIMQLFYIANDYFLNFEFNSDRRLTNTDELVVQYILVEGKSVKEVEDILGISTSYIYRVIRQFHA